MLDASYDASTCDPRPCEWGERDEGDDQEAQGDRNRDRNEIEAGHVDDGESESSVIPMSDEIFWLGSIVTGADAMSLR